VPYTAIDHEGGMNYYRLNDHKDFADKLGLGTSDFKIFPLMSRDWQIQYSNEQARQHAISVLSDLMVNGTPLFNIRENTDGFIFVETAYTKGINPDSQIQTATGKTIAGFKEVFTNIAIKSGHHSGIGNLWISDPAAIEAKKNQEISLARIYDLNLQALGVKQNQAITNTYV
jgi:hypothetical protein